MSVTPTLRNGDVDTSFARPMWEGAGTLGPYATGLGDTGLGSLLRPPIDTRPRGPVNRGGRRSPLPVAPVPAVRTPTAPIPATRTPIRPPTPMPASMRPARRAPIEITVPTGSPPIPVPLPRLSRPEPRTSGIKMSPTLRDWIMGGDSSDETPRERRVSLR